MSCVDQSSVVKYSLTTAPAPAAISLNRINAFGINTGIEPTTAFVRLSEINPDGWKLNVGHRDDVQKPVGLQIGYLHQRRDCVRLVQHKSGERAFEVIEVHGEILQKIRWCQSCSASMNLRDSVSKKSLPAAESPTDKESLTVQPAGTGAR